VRRRQLFAVKDFAIGGCAPMKGLAVPRGHAGWRCSQNFPQGNRSHRLMV
jgi:hypothetical protein